jgi:hypothetical protein
MPTLGPLCFTLTLAIASGLGASRSAIADTISTFQLATSVADGTVNGNLQIDTTTGKPEYGDFHVSLGGGAIPSQTSRLLGSSVP